MDGWGFSTYEHAASEAAVRMAHRQEKRLHDTWVPHVPGMSKMAMASRQAKSTHYEVLEIGPRSTASEVRAAYLRMATKTHPDRGGTEEAFSKVLAAYNVLSDPAARAAYDHLLAVEDAQALRY